LVFISAAEPSADLHGAALIRATKAKCATVRFVGVAGPRMVAEGCHPLFDMTRHSAMLLGALRAISKAAAMLSTSKRHLRRYPFDGAVVIDSPTLHLPLAKHAQALDIPVMYYIAPQMWAWGSYRIHKLRNHVDRVACILPFEEGYFRDRGVNARYVGHPLAETLSDGPVEDEIAREMRAREGPVVALLPGSRRHVVEEVLRGQLEVARRIGAVMPEVRFAVSVANPQVAPAIDALLSAERGPVRVYAGKLSGLIRSSDLVLVASGTAALEVAFYERPMIVMYNASRLFYHCIGRWLIHTRHLSLPNILAGREIVPEFMPYYRSTEPIAQQAIELLQSGEKREAMRRDLARLVEPLRAQRASERVADMLLDMTQQSRH
jgi:lipid-A-disaccharide synthase